MEKDWSFLITERPDRPQKPESLDGEHSPNASQQSQTSVPVLSVQQVIDHSSIGYPVTDPRIFWGFGGSRLHAVALENLVNKKIGCVAAENYEVSTALENVTDVVVKPSGWDMRWAFEDDVRGLGLSKGPIAACIRVTQEFIDYKGGVYCEHHLAPTRSDKEKPVTSYHRKSYHFVLIVGSGTEDGMKYLKIFNPWSEWGECNGAGIRGFGKVCRDESCGFMILNCAVTCHVEIPSKGN